MSLAVVVIASDKRRETTFPRCLDSVRRQAPDEIVVVADFPCEAKDVRCLRVEPMLRNTIDALVKRDVGWMATTSDHVMYLCDDHVLAPDFVNVFKFHYDENTTWDTMPVMDCVECGKEHSEYLRCKPWDILVPSRYCIHDQALVWLNVGQDLNYAGGHAAIYKRWCGYALPWAATFHHPNWDVLHSIQLKDQGASLVYTGRDLAIEDIEPEAEPWR